jgi:DNA-binding NarL/FixJ family response regulator
MKTNILIICRHADILATIVRLLNNNPDWNGIGAGTDEEALAAFAETDFALVLIGSGVEPESEQRLSDAFNRQQPGIKIVQHYGGGSGLLSAEVYGALGGV